MPLAVDISSTDTVEQILIPGTSHQENLEDWLAFAEHTLIISNNIPVVGANELTHEHMKKISER